MINCAPGYEMGPITIFSIFGSISADNFGLTLPMKAALDIGCHLILDVPRSARKPFKLAFACLQALNVALPQVR